MDVETTIKVPLRPMLLVISGSDITTESLAEQVGRAYAESKRRLTEKFSKKHWDIPIVSLDDPEAMEKAWRGMEEVQMAILTGYDGSTAHKQTLQTLGAAANPVSVLVNPQSAQADARPFDKSVSLLPGTLAEHFDVANSAMKWARNENAFKPDAPGERPEGRRVLLQ